MALVFFIGTIGIFLMGHFNQPPSSPFLGDPKKYLPPLNNLTAITENRIGTDFLGWTRKKNLLFSLQLKWKSGSVCHWSLINDQDTHKTMTKNMAVCIFSADVGVNVWTITKVKVKHACSRWWSQDTAHVWIPHLIHIDAIWCQIRYMIIPYIK